MVHEIIFKSLLQVIKSSLWQDCYFPPLAAYFGKRNSGREERRADLLFSLPIISMGLQKEKMQTSTNIKRRPAIQSSLARRLPRLGKIVMAMTLRPIWQTSFPIQPMTGTNLLAIQISCHSNAEQTCYN